MKKRFITLLLGSLLVLNLGCTNDSTENFVTETKRTNQNNKETTDLLYKGNGVKIKEVDGWEKVKESKEEDPWLVEFQHISGEGNLVLSEVSSDLSKDEIITEFQKSRPHMVGIDRFDGGFFFGIEQESHKYGKTFIKQIEDRKIVVTFLLTLEGKDIIISREVMDSVVDGITKN
ncbi:hypothetical protein [Bacillus solimangrovi]|uniref:Lipoprotein n=1 Tax=Bacillus solimangrovi TaxID=1305675 RepID=A0A1E5LAK5_9BACI|nr:hypothetical protein [Bacillus solimangrovi]OEH91128.1 hypothetical protein BFG57_07085 [Bacillus solimangrovi]